MSDELLECVDEGAKAEADAKVRAKGSNRTMFTDVREKEKYKSQIDKDSYRKMDRWVVEYARGPLAPHTSYVSMDMEISRRDNKKRKKQQSKG